MRIRTDGDYAHRLDAIESAMDALGENTKTAAVIAACEHARQDRNAKQKALAHPDMTPELAEVLSTPAMGLRYEIETSLDVD
ncbi:uncharacterized protein HHUB_2187 [Halobacterium hubeiense]|uniref:DUF7692 domain-containing protein n=1 Tax=Halobacterium hubeiense TaxID=1407499 RepID=A0A0U5H1E9_9EURY|nr:hypothetical protein [Halobacterium hubeiense]CQH55134.1 uncharacterized protein HHUB_2187 [Halobacterium hubeiense]